MAHKYSAQEVGILRSLFDQVDLDRAGKIHVNQLPGLCAKLGKSQGSSRFLLLEISSSCTVAHLFTYPPTLQMSFYELPRRAQELQRSRRGS